MDRNIYTTFFRSHSRECTGPDDYCSALEGEQIHLTLVEAEIVAAALEVAEAKKNLFSANMILADKCCCRRVLRFLHLKKKQKMQEEELRRKYAETLDHLASVCKGALTEPIREPVRPLALEEAHHQLLDHIQWLLGSVTFLPETVLADPAAASLAEDVSALVKQLSHEGLSCIFYRDDLPDADKQLFDWVRDKTVSGCFTERPAILRKDVVVMRGKIVSGE